MSAYCRHCDEQCINGDNGAVCGVCHDRRLVRADVAPDLLAALRGVVTAYEERRRLHEWDIAAVRAAIAKAEGTP